jgi:Uma2 family endonuclease
MSVPTEATSAPTQAPPAGGGVVPYRLTVDQFLRMIDVGIFRERDHVELLGGILVRKMTKNDPHDFAIETLGDILRRLPSGGLRVREEKSVVLGAHWRPEPDIAVVRAHREGGRIQAPAAADLLMLVEVADSSYTTDRGLKWRRYAASGVPVYWIVNIPGRRVEVYSAPDGSGAAAVYRDERSFGPDDEIPIVIEGREVGRLAVRDILP